MPSAQRVVTECLFGGSSLFPRPAGNSLHIQQSSQRDAIRKMVVTFDHVPADAACFDEVQPHADRYVGPLNQGRHDCVVAADISYVCAGNLGHFSKELIRLFHRGATTLACCVHHPHHRLLRHPRRWHGRYGADHLRGADAPMTGRVLPTRTRPNGGLAVGAYP